MPAPNRLDAHASCAALFGSEIRRLRELRDWSQTDLAGVLGWSEATVASVENTRRKPPPGFGEKVDAVFELPGIFARMAEVARETHSWLHHYVDLEAVATDILIWDMRLVHGLFQTKEYARAVLTAGRMRNESDAQIERSVAERMARQAILHRTDPPAVSYVMSEAVLRQPTGGVPVMRVQLAALMELAELPHISIQVLPFSAAEHAGSSGPFTILQFAEDPAVAFAEGTGSGRLIDEGTELADVTQFYNRITAAALSPEASIGMMTGAMDTLWTPRA